jgi:dipeptidyl aminopeptidase/acylaminoacyl peptidase
MQRLTGNKVFKARVRPQWSPDNNRFWYRNDLADGRREFVLVDAAAGKKEPAFDHERLAAAMAKVTGKTAQADRLPVETLAFRDTGLTAVLRGEGKKWQCDLQTYELKEIAGGGEQVSSIPAQEFPRPTRQTGPETTITFVNRTDKEVKLFWMDEAGERQDYGVARPGEKRELHTFEGHVWLVMDADGKSLGTYRATESPGTVVVDGSAPVRERRGRGPRSRDRATSGTAEGGGNSKWIAFVKEHNVWLRERATGKEEPLTRDGTSDDAYDTRTFWSPDATRLVVLKTKAGEEHKVYMVESSPKDQVQPKLRTVSYQKPGDRIAVTKPHLFDMAARKEIPVSDSLFPNPWEIEEVRWESDSRRFTFVYNQRGHQILRIIAVDAQTGQAQAIVDEQSKTFIDYAGKQFAEYLDKTHEIVWMSERDGWNHLYLYDAQTGKVKNRITRGEWVVRQVDRVDEEKRQVWFRAGGIIPRQDPYHVHYCRINFDGSGLTLLTEGDGTHSIAYSPDKRFYLDTYSRVDVPPVTELRRTEDGKLVRELERADAAALLATGWRPPERFVAKGRDGKTDIYGVIIRPMKFDPGRRYPVIENIYAGPQGSFVPKAWSALLDMQELAELGFVLVQIDGMGTSNRSKAFQEVSWKNLGDAGFPDRILWMKAAAQTRPWMDLSRVGIYGGSAGGQNALRGLLAHPEFYKAGVADCGCHDNRMDKIWWNELWMSWPVGPEYAEQSNVTNAHELRGKLLLIVGELDNNVDPASTMQVVNALIKADKDFDLLVVPGGGHGSGGSPYGQRRTRDFFVRHLLGVEPRSRP